MKGNGRNEVTIYLHTCKQLYTHEKYSDENDSMFLTFPPHSVGLHLLTEIHLLVPCGRAARGGASEEVVGEGADDDGVLRTVHDPTRLDPAGSSFFYWMTFFKRHCIFCFQNVPLAGPWISGPGGVRFAVVLTDMERIGMLGAYAVIGFGKRRDSVFFLQFFL